MNILLTAIGGPSAICFAKSLAELDNVRLIGTSAEDDAIGRRLVDSFHIVPFASDPKYRDAMSAIIQSEQVDLVLPMVDEEMVYFSKHQSEFPCRVLVSPYETIRYTSDKKKMYDIVPELLPHAFEKESITTFPTFVKPDVGRGGKGSAMIHTAQHLSEIPAKGNLFQEVLKGPEISVDALFNFDGQLLVAVPRIRQGIDLGISTSGSVIHEPTLMRIVDTIAQRLKFVGPINFQFMRSQNGYKLIEINARGSGGMGITVQSGADMPKLVYELVSKGSLTKIPAVHEGTYENFPEVLERQRIKKRPGTQSV